MAPFRIARPRFLAYFLGELGLIVGAVVGVANLTLQLAPDQSSSQTLVPTLIISGMFCALLLAMHWANLGDFLSPVREIVIFGTVSLLAGSVAFSALWLLFGESGGRFSALLSLEGAVAAPVAFGLWRWLAARLKLLDGLREHVLIVGSGEVARDICRTIVQDHAGEYGVIGFAEETNERIGTVLAMGVRVQTDFASLARFCQERTDRVIVALDEKRGKLPVRQLMELRLQGIEVEDSTSFLERIDGKIAVENMLPSWLIFSEGFKTTRLRMVLKRVADIGLASLLFAVTLPLMLCVALLIRLDSRGPILFRQKRLGRDAREYELLKFRSMREDAESETGPTWASENDPRITRVGRVIRKLRIDELPQVINVLRGDMSFVGPRPEREHFVRQLEERIPYYRLRMIVRPGITGWAQVEYGYGDSEDDALEKLKYDLYYIKNHNLLLDHWIVLKTIKVVLFGKGR